MAEEDIGQQLPQMPTGDAKRDYLDRLSSPT